jgi:hypothetical protein
MAKPNKRSNEKTPIHHVYIRPNTRNWDAIARSIDIQKSWCRVLFGADHLLMKPFHVEAAARLKAEIVVDLKTAEAAAPGRYGSLAGKLPWSKSEAPWTVEEFQEAGEHLLEAMADAVTTNQSRLIDAVLAPTHLVRDAEDPWLRVDVDAFPRFRRALDERQGQRIDIDYLLIATFRLFQDRNWRRQVIAAIEPLPFRNLWLRIGDFGAGEERRVPELLDIMKEFHGLGRPIVLDMAGGLAGVAMLAAGGANAIAHGAGSQEKCDLKTWLKEPKKGGGGGGDKTAYFPALYKNLSVDQWNDIFSNEDIPSHFSCTSSGCCETDESVFNDTIGHFMRQRAFQIQEITTRSSEYFGNGYLRKLAARANGLKDLAFKDPDISKAAVEFSKKAERLGEDLAKRQLCELRPAPEHRALPGREKDSFLHPQLYRPPRARRPKSEKPPKPPTPPCPDTPDLF